MSNQPAIETKRTNLRLMPDHKRVVGAYLNLGEEVATAMLDDLAQWSDGRCEEQFAKLIGGFKGRHRDLPRILKRNYMRARSTYSGNQIFAQGMSTARKRMLATCFSCEYSIEAAALFNPSIVRSPDQSGLDEGDCRCILSLRAVGEGHISSIVFREVILKQNGSVKLLPGSRLAEIAESYSEETESGYRLQFDTDSKLSQRTIFPHAPWEGNGMEDARFTGFEDEGRLRYLATYTAYDGRQIRPAWLETADFQSFEAGLFSGAAARNKNLAFFPRKFKGQYAMLSRLDGRNNYIMFSDRPGHWDQPHLLSKPDEAWELIKSGNCGSPIETEEGWLVLTHGVGPMRRYCIGAMLLDLEDPQKVIGRLSGPLLEPNEQEREGYVPNVLYSCGGMIFNNHLYLPYAASDLYCSLATVELDELLDAML